MDVYGLVGNPVDHSRSPPMHEAAYEALGLGARYVTFGVDSGKFETAVEGAVALGVAGLNVTVPFKRDAVDHPAVEPAPDAARVGAANTLLLDGDSIVAHNTDVDGVIRSFERHDVALDGADAVLVGAGGAARAAAVALVDAGATVHVANRTVERAESLAADLRALDGDPGNATDDGTTAADAPFGDRTATAAGLDSLAATVPEADVLLNATSVGMEAPEETAVDGDLLHADLAVLDAVYAPLRTRLLREAEAAGATTIDGAWMLLYQGVAALELWTEREAPVEAMNEALRATL